MRHQKLPIAHKIDKTAIMNAHFSAVGNTWRKHAVRPCDLVEHLVL